MDKLIRIIGLMMLSLGLGTACSAFADEPYFYWTGAAGDGKWSTASNWTNAVGECVAPEKAGGNQNAVLVFPGGSVSSNDWESSTAHRILFRGEGDTVVRGGKITFDTSQMINVNASHVIIYNDVVSRWSSDDLRCDYGELVFAGHLTTWQNLTVRGSADTGSKEGKIRFLGGVSVSDGLDKDFNLYLGASDDPGKTYAHHLESAVKVNKFTIGGTYRWVDMTIDVGGQEWGEVQLNHGHVHAGAANVFAPNAVVIPYSTYVSDMAYWDLNGYDQSIDRIAGDYKDTTFVSESMATLTMNASGDGNFAGPFAGALSVVWNPSEASTFDASGTSTMTGDILVKGGVFLVSGAGSFANVKNVSVSSGATLSLTTTAAGALADLENLLLDGTLSLSAGTDRTFSKARIVLGTSGKIAVPFGTVLTVPAIRVGSSYVADKEYAGESWIEGGGTVKVDSSMVSDEAFVWKDAVNGSWSEGANWFGNAAPNGTKPQRIAVGGADFTVTVPNETSIVKPLTVGGHSQAGVATVEPQGSLSLAAGSRTVIGANGKFSVPTGSSITIPTDTSVAVSEKIVEVSNGGVFEVCGGTFAADNFHGLFQVGAGGALNVTSGRFDILPYMPSAANYASTLKVLQGGKISVSGDGVMAFHDANYLAYPLMIDGGVFEASGRAKVFFDSTQGKDLSAFIGGSGTFRLSGQAQAAIEDGAAGSLTFVNWTGNGVSKIEVCDQAAFCMTNSSTFVVGTELWDSPDNCRMEVIFDSEATNYMGNAFYFGVDGIKNAQAVMRIKRGRVQFGGRGLLTARRSNPPATITSPRAEIEVSGGVCVVSGVNADQNESYYSAFELGNSLPEDSKTSATAIYTSTFDLTGGIVSNLHGRITLGTGKALGKVVQSGGAFVSGSRAAAFFGAYDGEGRWEMTGGTATFNETIYLGIGSTLATLLGNYAKCNLGSHVVGTAARGVIDIEAGTFETAGDIISGTDGNTGSITVGPAGVLKAKNLQMLNAAADTLTVKVGPNGAGKIELSNTLDLAEGIKLKIDGAGTYVGEPAKFDLLKCKDSTRPLTELTIEGEIPAKMRLSRTPSRIRLVTDPTGMMLILR